MNLVLLLKESEVKVMQLSPLDKRWGPTTGQRCTPGQAAFNSSVSTETKWKMGEKKCY